MKRILKIASLGTSAILLYTAHTAHALVAAFPLTTVTPTPEANFLDAWTRPHWHLGWTFWGNALSVVPLIILFAVTLIYVAASYWRQKQRPEGFHLLPEIGALLRVHAVNLGLFVLFLASSFFLAIPFAFLQQQWFRVNAGSIDYYLVNLILWAIGWYLLACVTARIDKKYLFIVLLAVLIAVGALAYAQSVGIVHLQTSQSVPTSKVSWLSAVGLINECQAYYGAVDPYLVLKDGRVVVLADPPGYASMTAAVSDASPQCGSIPIVPN